MTNEINLKEIRRQIYLSFTEDGLIDLALGAILFGFGALLLTDISWMVGFLGVPAMLIFLFGKQFITIPRTGSITMGESMRKEFRLSTTGMILFGIGSFIFFVLLALYKPEISFDLPLVLFGVVLGFGVGAAGILMKSKRILAYAVVVILIIAGNAFVQLTIGSMDSFITSVMTAGGILLVSGLIVLIRFLQNYPVINLEN